jgi:Caspase domain
LEVDGTNYLIPIDAKLETDLDVEDEAISLDRVLRMPEPARNLRLVILDACRDNFFVKTMKRTLGSRSFSRGLAGVEPTTPNTLIAFAAKAGSTASDGDGAHSPFTSALLKHLTAPGLDLRIAFGKVRDEVLATTGAKQEPHVYTSIGGATIALVPAGEVSGTPAAPAPTGDVGSESWRDYELAMQVGTKEALDAFLAAHPTGFYANLARAQRAKLLAIAPATPPAAATVPTISTASPPEPQTRGKTSAARHTDSPAATQNKSLQRKRRRAPPRRPDPHRQAAAMSGGQLPPAPRPGSTMASD